MVQLAEAGRRPLRALAEPRARSPPPGLGMVGEVPPRLDELGLQKVAAGTGDGDLRNVGGRVKALVPWHLRVRRQQHRPLPRNRVKTSAVSLVDGGIHVREAVIHRGVGCRPALPENRLGDGGAPGPVELSGQGGIDLVLPAVARGHVRFRERRRLALAVLANESRRGPNDRADTIIRKAGVRVLPDVHVGGVKNETIDALIDPVREGLLHVGDPPVGSEVPGRLARPGAHVAPVSRGVVHPARPALRFVTHALA
mmetsp:Transcript_59424/g.181316  ORF Transcript_59424/g.181316 Transcript_59424/m.181316 type:complete len:255 (+) Transcript_59424:835-1599(+)